MASHSRAKVLLLAVHLASHADTSSFVALAGSNSPVLNNELTLRILLTYLPETVNPSTYADFLAVLAKPCSTQRSPHELNFSPVEGLSEDQARKKLRKLRLMPFSCSDVHQTAGHDAVGRFLITRARLMHSEAGLLTQIMDLLLPFIHHYVALYEWTACTVIPYIRKNLRRGTRTPYEGSLLDFEKLTDRQASEYFLASSNFSLNKHEEIDYALRHIIGPWVYHSKRWKEASCNDSTETSAVVCDGWEHVLQWLVASAPSSWDIVLPAIKAWNGPGEVEFAHGISVQLPQSRLDYLRQTYARMTLACVFVVQETSLDCLRESFAVLANSRSNISPNCLGLPSLEDVLSTLPDIPTDADQYVQSDSVSLSLRHGLLNQDNPLTKANEYSLWISIGLTLSAYILTFHGSPTSVRRVGDLRFRRDARDQKSEVLKFLHAIRTLVDTKDDGYLRQSRNQLLWLRHWGNNNTRTGRGIFGLIDDLVIETEFLKLLLSVDRYELARSLYGDKFHQVLSEDALRETIYQTALAAFDNASDFGENCTGLSRCEKIIHTFDISSPALHQVEAFMKAARALSNYQLLLKQGEPFSPVVLRVHSDPISIIGKVLEQNPCAYSRLPEFLETGKHIVRARSISQSNFRSQRKDVMDFHESDMIIAEKRITAMCISAALDEDDFETAYSYVANRLSSLAHGRTITDEWSWKAAVRAGQYLRTSKSQQPTHLGTGNGNLDIRHLQQRLDCLATALRVAPTDQIQVILKGYRRCEEQLDSLIGEQAANEDYWDNGIEARDPSGGLLRPMLMGQPQNGDPNAKSVARQTEEAPMTLFDLSRATARAARKNLTIIPSLNRMTGSEVTTGQVNTEAPRQSARRRDQLREAATGTLVSGVGWLIGANANPSDT